MPTRRIIATLIIPLVGVSALATSRASAAATDAAAPVTSIEQIQGRHHISTYAGSRVAQVTGVVTTLTRNGFWFQDPTPDTSDTTSAGLFVFTRAAPQVVVGDTVSIDGLVEEYRAGGSSGAANLTTTQLTSPEITVTGAAKLPEPVILGVDRIAPQQIVDQDNPGSVESSAAAFIPWRDGLDFYESLEGMQVGVVDAQVVGPTASFGEIPVLPSSGVTAARSAARGVLYSGYHRPNTARVQIDDALLAQGAMPRASVGDRLPGTVSGPLDYSFANYKVLATRAPSLAPGGVSRERAPQQVSRDLSVASFNVENLAPGNDQRKFDRLASQIVSNLRGPDIIAMEEVQDNSGATDDAVVDSSRTTDALIEAISAAGGPRYEAQWVNPQDGADGGQPGGNIRNVLLHRTDRPLRFVTRHAGAPGRATAVITDAKGAKLTESPGRIAPDAAAFADSRKPLIGEYLFRGERVFVAAVHFSSKGGDDPLMGRWQQPVRGSEQARHGQARAVRDLADDLLTADPEANLVVAGDVNDFEFSQTTDILVGTGATALTDLPRTLPAHERWTYIYEGNSQVLDHILLSPALAGSREGDYTPPRPGQGPGHLAGRARFTYDIVHTNAAFADQDSDHDPQVVHIRPEG